MNEEIKQIIIIVKRIRLNMQAVWSKALPLTAYCLSTLPRFES